MNVSMPRGGTVPPLSLKLFQPDHNSPDPIDDSDELGRLTMRQAFEMHLLKDYAVLPPPFDKAELIKQIIEYYSHPPGQRPERRVRTDNDSTIDLFYDAIQRWEEFNPQNPTQSEFDLALMEQFRGSIEGKRSNATLNKWISHLRIILNRMGQPGNSEKSQANLGYFHRVPYLRKFAARAKQEPRPSDEEDDELAADPDDPYAFTEEQINRAYNSCRVTSWPPQKRTGVEPRIWWQVSFVFLVNYGFRCDDWLWLRRSLFNAARTRFWYCPKKTRKWNKWINLVCNDTVRAHLALLPEIHADYIFNPTKCDEQLYREWHKIMDDAQLQRRDGTPFKPHDLRRTAGQRYASKFPGTGDLLLGHGLKGSKVFGKSYAGSKLMVPVWQAIREMPQPAAFLPVTEAWLEAQRFGKSQLTMFQK